MPEPKPPKGKTIAPTTPDTYLTAPPQQLPGADYSYTVELVGSIQNQLGKLTQAVETLSERAKSQGEKLDNVCRDVHTAKVILGIVGAVLLVFLAAFFKSYLDHLWPSAKSG